MKHLVTFCVFLALILGGCTTRETPASFQHQEVDIFWDTDRMIGSWNLQFYDTVIVTGVDKSKIEFFEYNSWFLPILEKHVWFRKERIEYGNQHFTQEEMQNMLKESREETTKQSFIKHGDTVYNTYYTITWAAPETLVPLLDIYAMDQNHLYCQWQPMDVDLDSFIITWFAYVLDHDKVYWWCTLMSWVDAKTFQMIWHGFEMAKDKNFLYLHGAAISDQLSTWDQFYFPSEFSDRDVSSKNIHKLQSPSEQWFEDGVASSFDRILSFEKLGSYGIRFSCEWKESVKLSYQNLSGKNEYVIIDYIQSRIDDSGNLVYSYDWNMAREWSSVSFPAKDTCQEIYVIYHVFRSGQKYKISYEVK